MRRAPRPGPRRRRLVLAAVAILLAWAGPVLAYILPVSGILRRLGQRRQALALASMEVRGGFTMPGGAARAAALLGLQPAGADLSAPARLTFKMPARCRLELASPDLPEGQWPAAVVRQDQLRGTGGLDRVPAAAALLRGLCALLARAPGSAEPGRPWAEELARLGVPLSPASLGRFGDQIAFVIGGRPGQQTAQAWVDKQTFQPLRLLFRSGDALVDVRLLDWGSPTGGDWFPRAVEVWQGGALQARFVTEKATANPKVPDALF